LAPRSKSGGTVPLEIDACVDVAFLQPHTANLTQHPACVAPETNQAVSAGKKHHSQTADLWACFEVAECGGIHARDKPVRLLQPSLIWQLQAECLPTFDNFFGYLNTGPCAHSVSE